MIIPLPSNRPAGRFYRGGAGIAAFRGESWIASHEPEDWIASTTSVFGQEPIGQTRLPDGSSLASALAADPEHWLGREHAERWGPDQRLLVKLLDAGQRLPVHAHPHDDFAARHLGAAHGKAEAWYILRGGAVHLGLTRDVGAEELTKLVESQDTTTLLGLLHRVTVAPGDVVYVPPGELHAIGEGVLLLELQQPEDLSILLEWDGFALDGARSGHLGLGFATALEAVNTRSRPRESVDRLVRTAPPGGSVLPEEAEQYFRLERHRLGDGERRTLAPGWRILVVSGGEVEVDGMECAAGAVLLVPAAAGEIALVGSGEVLVARPPAP